MFGFYTVLFTACSLKYEDTVQVDSRVPEFVFENTTMTRYEDNDVTFQMNAALLEQYKNSNQTYAVFFLLIQIQKFTNFMMKFNFLITQKVQTFLQMC